MPPPAVVDKKQPYYMHIYMHRTPAKALSTLSGKKETHKKLCTMAPAWQPVRVLICAAAVMSVVGTAATNIQARVSPGPGRALILRGGREARTTQHRRVKPGAEKWADADDPSAGTPDEGDMMAERQRLLLLSVEESPHDPLALGELGEFLWEQMGDLDGAEDVFRNAVASNPHDTCALTDLAAFLCEERGELQEAERLYRRAVDSSPADAGALCCLADFLATERNDIAGATEQYNKAVLHNPSDTDALCDFAAFLVEHHNSSAAEELLLHAVSCKPHSVDTLTSYADFLRSSKRDLQAAAACCLRSIFVYTNANSNRSDT